MVNGRIMSYLGPGVGLGNSTQASISVVSEELCGSSHGASLAFKSCGMGCTVLRSPYSLENTT